MINLGFTPSTVSNKRKHVFLINGFPGFWQNKDIQAALSKKDYEVVLPSIDYSKLINKGNAFLHADLIIQKMFKSLTITTGITSELYVISHSFGALFHRRLFNSSRKFPFNSVFIAPLWTPVSYRKFLERSGSGISALLKQAISIHRGTLRLWESSWEIFEKKFNSKRPKFPKDRTLIILSKDDNEIPIAPIKKLENSDSNYLKIEWMEEADHVFLPHRGILIEKVLNFIEKNEQLDV